MTTKKILPVLLLGFIALISVYATCNKPRLDCARTVYSFGLEIKAYPDKDSIHLGDTIWLEINKSTTLKDAMSGSMVDYSNAANLGSVVSFHKLSSMNQFTDKAADKFELVLSKGKQVSSLDPGFERQYLFSEENQHFVFKLAAIPKEAGTFTILFSNAANVYRKGDRCTKASFAMYFQNTNQHYYLNPNFPGGPVAPGGDYYFKVY